MVYIHNGKVVDKPPFSLTRFVTRIGQYAIFFVSSMLSTEPLSQQVQDFHTRDTAGRSTYRPFANILGFENGSRTGAPRADTATGRSSTIRSMPRPPLTGSCGAGG